MPRKQIKIRVEAVYPDEPRPEWRYQMFLEGLIEMASASGVLQRHLNRMEGAK